MPVGNRTPTKAELLAGALKLQNDVDWYNWRDGAEESWPGFEQAYDTICNDHLGGVPERIRNLGPDNQWGYDPGNECCWPENLGAVPPDLSPAQITVINARTKDAHGVCQPPTTAIVMAGEMAKAIKV